MAKTTHIIDWTRSAAGNLDAIQIEAYPQPAQLGFNNPYARFIVYPASVNTTIKTDTGIVTFKETASHAIEREQISFSGKTANAQFRIDSLVNVVGFFFDTKNRVISPAFSVKNGVLEASEECFGTGYISYNTSGRVYDYQIATLTTPGGVIIPLSPGTIFAFNPKKKGISATYAIPLHNSDNANMEEMLVVYSEVIVQGLTSFEQPDINWPTNNNYTHYPSALESEKPITDEGGAYQRDHESIFAKNGGIYHYPVAVNWYKPTAIGTTFQGVKYKLKNNIPSAPTETISQSMIDELNAKIIELTAKYPGLS